MTQGSCRKRPARFIWLSKDMDAHDDYMAGFIGVFSGLDWWRPATEAATRKALARVSFSPSRL